MPNEVKLLPCPPFQIGDEVAVIPGCADWASDWRDVRLWVAGLQAVPGGGFDYWVSDEWPLPERTALTDCFYMEVNGKPNMLTLVATRPTTVVTDEVVERVAGSINTAFNGLSIGMPLTQEEAFTLARAALASMPTVVTGEQPLQKPLGGAPSR